MGYRTHSSRNEEPGGINWVERGWHGPPPWLWMAMFTVLMAFCLYSLYVYAAAPRTSSCSWQRCKVNQEGKRLYLVDCEDAQYGSHLDLAFAFQQIHEPNRAIKYICEPVEDKP
jgi:hypothetical protein